MKRFNKQLSVFSLLGLIGVLLLSGCQRDDAPPQVLRGSIFGTFYEVSISSQEQFDQEAIQDGVLQVLNEVDRQMSTYKEHSVLNQINRAPIGEAVVVPDELFYVLSTAQQVSTQSGGAFDTTVGGLVNLWGFGPEGRIASQPDEQELQHRLSHIGFQFIELNEAKQTVTRHADVFIDLSGIAKGFGVDQVSDYLLDQGIDNHLVNLGGDLRAHGMRNKSQPWRIGIEVPTDRARMAQQIMPIHDQAILGSGDYRNYFEENGVRYSHTIDPITGRPIAHKLAAVHVVMDSATEADAWATALMVKGEKEGFELANKLHIAAIFVYRHQGEFHSLMTDAFIQDYQDTLVVPTVY